MDLEYEKQRESLLQKLLDSVKQCQVAFGGKSNLATDKDSSVSCMVNQFEQALQHGLKKNKLLEKITSLSEPFRQVTQKMLPEIETTYWSLVKEIISPLDVQLYQTMEGVTTDSGRARIWLRTAINENSLERHLNAILSNLSLVRQYYEAWALLLDEERSSTLPIMAQGLGSILFAIETKNLQLNQPFKSISFNSAARRTHHRVHSSPLPVMAGFSTEPAILKKINVKKKKKRKVINATITNLEETSDVEYSSSYTGRSSSYIDSADFLKEDNLHKARSNEDIDPNCDENTLDNKHPVQFDLDGPVKGSKSAPVSPLFGCSIEDFPGQPESQVPVSTEQPSLKTNSSVSGTQNLFSERFENDNKIKTNKLDNVSNSTSLESHSEQCLIAGNDDTSVELLQKHERKNGDKIVENGLIWNNEQISQASGINDPMENESISSSNGSTQEDIDTCPVVGSHNSKYMKIFMSYDQETSKAATDTLALLSASSSDNQVFKLSSDTADSQAHNFSANSMEKYIPKIPQTHMEVADGDLSTVDLKQAILATAKKKDEVVQENKVLKTALEEQRELTQVLQCDYEKLSKERQEAEDLNRKKIHDMNREIDVLKNQLKKYVAAVQMLRNDRILTDEAKEAIGNLRITDDVTVPPRPAERTNSENTSIFEDKLAQMAEMHGELLEFQENLQRQLINRENIITHMKKELVSLRGPLPDEKESSSTAESSEGTYTGNRLLINIWVPSVFLKGKGTDAHHLYQIYVRIGDEEWNIYRRYSQFNKLHLQMSKMFPILETFNFPKKKMFGKKDLKFVEERRRRLQEYLRTLINTLISSHTELSSDSSKKQLVCVLPFFSEKFGIQEESKKSRQSLNKDKAPHYTGL